MGLVIMRYINLLLTWTLTLVLDGWSVAFVRCTKCIISTACTNRHIIRHGSEITATLNSCVIVVISVQRCFRVLPRDAMPSAVCAVALCPTVINAGEYSRTRRFFCLSLTAVTMQWAQLQQ